VCGGGGGVLYPSNSNEGQNLEGDGPMITFVFFEFLNIVGLGLREDLNELNWVRRRAGHVSVICGHWWRGQTGP
jgi:hypothetical protein